MQSVAQRLIGQGLPMLEFPQSVPNLTEASTNLYELLKGKNLQVYADDDIRLAISRCVALETSRGWKIAKEKASHKIDVVVALAQAALGAVQQGQVASGVDLDLQARASQMFRAETVARQLRHAEDGPSSFGMPSASDYANGDGRDVARREDAAVMHMKKRFGKWSSF
jgi:hypothetical protein